MEFNKNTKLKDILAAYPWLLDELVEMDERFRIMKTPPGKLYLRKATIEDLSKKAGKTPEKLIDKLNRIIEKHN